MIQISHDVVLTIVTCCTCGTPFGIEANRQRKLSESGDTFWCPNGHTQVYTEPMAVKLKRAEKLLAEERSNSTFWRTEADQAAGELTGVKKDLKKTKTELTRTKKRIAAGICPCCNRQFVDLHRHMVGQHPDYVAEQLPFK